MAFRGLTIAVPSPTTKLTTRSRVKAALGTTTTGNDALIDRAINAASAAAETYCNRAFNRQTYREVGPAYGNIEFQCKQAPVIALGIVTYNSGSATDVTIGDQAQGVLYRAGGFTWTAQSIMGLSAGAGFFDIATPLPGEEEPLWDVTYTAGFIPPYYDLTAIKKISVLTSDNSFNTTGSRFVVSLLSAGDIIETAGFGKPANVGRFVVTGTPTSAKIKVTATLSTEAATTGQSVTMTLQNLPYDVEQAVIETAKTYYLQRAADSNVVQKGLGIASIRYGESSLSERGLPVVAQSLLRGWRRLA